MIDKLLKNVGNLYNRKKELELFDRELIRYKNYPELSTIDMYNLMLCCSYSLFGLNKEGIERSNNNYDYELFPKLDLEEAKQFEQFKSEYDYFESGRIIDTKFNDWLTITNINHKDNLNNGFLFNVRNALMHSEFSIDSKEGYVINIKNSNYTGFEGKIFFQTFLNFSSLYFGNNYWSGIVENHISSFIPDELSNGDEDLKEILKKVDVRLSNITDKKTIKKLHILAKKHAEKEMGNILMENSQQINIDDKLELIFNVIKSIYGNEFYTYDLRKQSKIITSLIKFILDSKSVVSDWIIHYMHFANSVIIEDLNGDDFTSIYAAKPSLLILKSYMVMYMLQNKNIKEIDSTKIYIPNHNYYDNLGTPAGTNIVDPELFCDIFRNSLAHGNVDIKLEVQEELFNIKFVLTDKYKSKERILEINMNELDKFLASEPFLPINCLKDDLSIRKSK